MFGRFAILTNEKALEIRVLLKSILGKDVPIEMLRAHEDDSAEGADFSRKVQN